MRVIPVDRLLTDFYSLGVRQRENALTEIELSEFSSYSMQDSSQNSSKPGLSGQKIINDDVDVQSFTRLPPKSSRFSTV